MMWRREYSRRGVADCSLRNKKDPFRSSRCLGQRKPRPRCKPACFLSSDLPFEPAVVKRPHVQKPWNMNSITARTLAIGLAVGTMFHPQVSSADGFDGASLMEWSEASQVAYLQNSIVMTMTVSSRRISLAIASLMASLCVFFVIFSSPP